MEILQLLYLYVFFFHIFHTSKRNCRYVNISKYIANKVEKFDTGVYFDTRDSEITLAAGGCKIPVVLKQVVRERRAAGWHRNKLIYLRKFWHQNVLPKCQKYI